MKKHFFILILLATSVLFGQAQGFKKLTKEEANQLTQTLIEEWQKDNAVKYADYLEKGAVNANGLQMRFMYQIYGEEPADGRSLWISLHGGGGTTSDVNDQQWQNQIRLYQPAEGVYVAPRAPWDAWDMWFQKPIDALYDELIHTCINQLHVNPNKVYILGYSAGGDGVWRMAPRMADHWAAASMMAGHPGDVKLDNLRNLPFLIWCGANDEAYNRNKECYMRGLQMDSLQQAEASVDPQAYIHQTHIIDGKGHWMDRVDGAALPWMAQYQRNPYPKKIVWEQEEVLRPTFYWLEVREEEMERGKRVEISIEDNTIRITRCDYTQLSIYLNDQMVDLDKKIIVEEPGMKPYKISVSRSEIMLKGTLEKRQDPAYVFPACLRIIRLEPIAPVPVDEPAVLGHKIFIRKTPKYK